MFGYTSVTAIPRDSIRNRSHACMDSAWVSLRPLPHSIVVALCSHTQEL